MNERGAAATSFGTTRALTEAETLRIARREEVESIVCEVVVVGVVRLEMKGGKGKGVKGEEEREERGSGCQRGRKRSSPEDPHRILTLGNQILHRAFSEILGRRAQLNARPNISAPRTFTLARRDDLNYLFSIVEIFSEYSPRFENSLLGSCSSSPTLQAISLRRQPVRSRRSSRLFPLSNELP